MLGKDEAHYIDVSPYPGERCGLCTMFRPPDDCTLVRGKINPRGYCVHFDSALSKSLAHSADTDLHVRPENAVPISLPVADAVTRANVQHVSWEMVRVGKYRPTSYIVPLDSIIATQQVVDRERVARHEAMLRETGSVGESAPLAILWDGDLFLLGGHHGLQAAKNLGVREVTVDVMEP